jgi:hypothetical protein
MHTGQLGGPIALQDPATGQQVQAQVQGTFSFQVAGDPNAYLQHVQNALMQATSRVIQAKLSQNQVALPTLAQSLPYFTQEIVAQSGTAQMGVQVGQLQLSVQVQQPGAVQPYQGQLPPDPHTQMQNRMAQIAQERLDPRNYEYEAQVNIGGFKLKASTDKGFDSAGLTNQVKEKAKTEIIWWGIGCVVVGLVLIGLAGLAWYVYAQYKAGEKKGNWESSSAEAGGDDKKSGPAEESKWDGKSGFSCGAGDKIKIKGVKADIKSGSAINAGADCQLELEDVDITAPVGIQAGANAVVTVKNGSVNGKDAAAKALGNSKIVFNGTKVTGKKQALGGAKIEGP